MMSIEHLFARRCKACLRVVAERRPPLPEHVGLSVLLRPGFPFGVESGHQLPGVP